MKFQLTIVLLLILLVWACKDPAEEKKSQIVAGFTVDPSLLENDTYPNKQLNFIFRVPKEWIVTEKQNHKDSLIGFVDSYNVDPLVKFEDKNGEGFVSINIWKQRMSDTLTTDSLLSHFQALDYWLEVQHSNFSHNCFNIDQFVLQNANHVCFKLICQEMGEEEKFEISYVVERKKIATIVRSIESSIGSLNCII